MLVCNLCSIYRFSHCVFFTDFYHKRKPTAFLICVGFTMHFLLTCEIKGCTRACYARYGCFLADKYSPVVKSWLHDAVRYTL